MLIKFSTKVAITTMVKNFENGRLKTILEAVNLTAMNEAVTKFLCSTEMTGNHSVYCIQEVNNPMEVTTTG